MMKILELVVVDILNKTLVNLSDPDAHIYLNNYTHHLWKTSKQTEMVNTNATKHSFMNSNILLQQRSSTDMTL